MSNAIKCIIRQGWTTRDADGNLIERRDYVYVTNEDGTPHVYASIAEARADIRGNYGRDANRAGILHTHSVDDYTGHVHEGYVYIVREDTDEFAAATADAKTEQAAAADMEQMDRLMMYAAEAIASIQQTAEPRPTYQRAELLAYLGEPDDYDVTAIEHDATEYDPATGRTVWAVDAETLAAIAERHQLQFYAPAF